MQSLVCIILASGFSRRFGADKLLHDLPSGRCVLEETVSLYQSCFKTVNVVIRPEHKTAENLLKDMKVEVIFNHCAHKGLSQAITAAVNSTEPETGWLFGLADMPYVTADTIRKIIASANENNIVQPSCNGSVGNPVFIGRNFKAELLRLEGDVGAKNIVRSADSLVLVDCDDQGIHRDIDTQEDLVFNPIS